MSDSLRPHGLQHARLPYPSPTSGAFSDSCPLSWWYHPTILSSDIPFTSCPQSLPASGSFPMSNSVSLFEELPNCFPLSISFYRPNRVCIMVWWWYNTYLLHIWTCDHYSSFYWLTSELILWRPELSFKNMQNRYIKMHIFCKDGKTIFGKTILPSSGKTRR